jgi:hypothetical protein
MKSLSEVRDPTHIDQAVEKDPSSTLLKLMAGVVKLTQQTGIAVQKLSSEIEPPALANIDLTSATRADLNTYLSNIKTAETNVAAASSTYIDLLKTERSEAEKLARSLNISEGVTRNFLYGVDERQARFFAFSSKMFAARADFYRAFDTLIAVLIQQYGNYHVNANGKFIFPDQSALDRFNAAANTLNVATTKVNQLEAEKIELEQHQQEGWKRFVSGTTK